MTPPSLFAVQEPRATATVEREGEARTYRISTAADLRDNLPNGRSISITESLAHARVRTGNTLYDALYALAAAETLVNSVSQISDGAYSHGAGIPIEAFQTGELWKYVWTRDLSYSLHLGLAQFDPQRAVNSLLFKASELKPSVHGGTGSQIVQDTGSGGSYPVSTDRVVWALGAHETLKFLPAADRAEFLKKIVPLLCNTAEQDRRLVFDPHDGLYRGEQSFLDWREQTYPAWTRDNVLAIGMSKALSTNAGHYYLLRVAADCGRQLGKTGAPYDEWAERLREAINRNFYDEKAGLYRTFLLSEDGTDSTPAARYDLLGESLAILFDIADADRARTVIRNYPTGPFGPPVVWPQEKTVPIYHNQAIWPFATAYWIKAARKAGEPAAVDAGLESLQNLAADNLSNMENFDFVTGRAMSTTGTRRGPVINSRRQLWSVAGYLSSVQDVAFGMEASLEGIRFRPFVTAKMRNETFAGTDAIELRGFSYSGTRHNVRVHLPAKGTFTTGACTLERVELNGLTIPSGFVGAALLAADNQWELHLRAPPIDSPVTEPLRVVDVSDERTICGPVQPRWKDGTPGGGIEAVDGRVTLRYQHDDTANVAFDIFRDGQLCAGGVRETEWTDPRPGSSEGAHFYRIAAVDRRSGNVSHFTPSRTVLQALRVIPAAALRSRGGDLVEGNHHLENWGRPGDELVAIGIHPARDGDYAVQVEFANGAGPVNTGITCAVKKLEVRRGGAGGEVVAAGYLVMPQSGDWTRFDRSSALRVRLNAGEDYTLRLAEDEYCRNMSYLKSNARYNAAAGGGEDSYNFVNVASIRLFPIATRP